MSLGAKIAAMKRHAPFLLCLCAGLVNLGCDQFVDKSKYDAAMKEASQAKQELEQTKAALEACKQKPEHHYELRSEGFRTFRFDPSTGETCIKLTSPTDWKKPDTIRQGCEYEDYVNPILILTSQRPSILPSVTL